jgi:CubicO group peptidase (beta-lactamase class C family)
VGESEYYPPCESRGGWRRADGEKEARELAGVDLRSLERARLWNLGLGFASSVVVIRKGYLVAEWHEGGATPETCFNIYSCTKSFTGTAFGILFGEGLDNGARGVSLESPAYAFLPEGWPLTDPRKERILLRHLLSMTSGIAGESFGLYGFRTAPGVSAFAAALGRAPFLHRDTGRPISVAGLVADPGTRWDYSDPAFAHLSLAFWHAAGQELRDFMHGRVFEPIGVENVHWPLLGLADDGIGRHCNPSGGIYISAREFARFGYLMLRGGRWGGRQIVPRGWLEVATRSSQELYPVYGLTWWVNHEGKLWPGVPPDAFAAMGFKTNLCCIIPSLDVVAVRIGLGPTEPTEFAAAPFLRAIAEAVVEP